MEHAPWSPGREIVVAAVRAKAVIGANTNLHLHVGCVVISPNTSSLLWYKMSTARRMQTARHVCKEASWNHPLDTLLYSPLENDCITMPGYRLKTRDSLRKKGRQR